VATEPLLAVDVLPEQADSSGTPPATAAAATAVEARKVLRLGAWEFVGIAPGHTAGLPPVGFINRKELELDLANSAEWSAPTQALAPAAAAVGRSASMLLRG
jgi:hypothetical protein